MTVDQALDHLRKSATREGVFYVYVVDDHEHLVGLVPLRRLITADPSTPVHAIRRTDVVSVTADTDQEEVARLVTKHHLLAVPVVDRDNRLLGTITIDDVIDVIHEEATEDIHRLGGVSADETIFDPAGKVVRRRLFWLLVNLPTAVLAATVVGLFEPSIQALAALAVFMPIVAGMGGNAGIQTFTVIVRAIALGDLTLANTRKVLFREVLIGLANGVGAGTVAGLIAYFWKGDPLLGLILGVAMITNMLVAALAGTLVPVALKRLRVDPAVATGVVVTTFTDCSGFLSFLGLATLLMRFLAPRSGIASTSWISAHPRTKFGLGRSGRTRGRTGLSCVRTRDAKGVDVDISLEEGQVRRAYDFYSPVYDFLFKKIFEPGRIAGIRMIGPGSRAGCSRSASARASTCRCIPETSTSSASTSRRACSARPRRRSTSSEWGASP